jgi:hypothetical protein
LAAEVHSIESYENQILTKDFDCGLRTTEVTDVLSVDHMFLSHLLLLLMQRGIGVPVEHHLQGNSFISCISSGDL